MILAFVLAPAFGGEIYVDDDCGPTQDGSPEAPYCTIDDAISASSSGDTIWVAPGTYGAAFNILEFPDGPQIKIRSTDGPGTVASPTTTIEAKIAFQDGNTEETVLEGFIITTDGTNQSIGIQSDGYPQIVGNIITGNSVTGINLNGGYDANQEVLIRDNIINDYGTTGIEIGEQNVRIADTVITGKAGSRGIDVYTTTQSPTVKIVDSVIEKNSSNLSGAGIHVDGPGTLWLVNTVLRDNDSAYGNGGAILLTGADQKGRAPANPCSETEYVHETYIQNCVFECNDGIRGGAIAFFGGVKAEIVNTTFFNNTATANGDSVYTQYSCVEIHNSILWPDDPEESGAEIYAGSNTDLDVTYSVLDDGCAGIGEENVYDLECSSNDVSSTDPSFADTDGDDNTACNDDDDLRVGSGSSAVDGGSNSLILDDVVDLDYDDNDTEATPLDLDRWDRIANTTVDAGAYEYGSCTTAADCDDEDDCNGAEVCVDGDCRGGTIDDCNANDVDDACDISVGTSDDCDDDGVPDECSPGTPDAVLTDTTFACDDTLPRSLDHVLRFTFACDITAPGSGDVEIRELLANGQFGSDLSSSFTFTVENGSVLRVEEDGTVLDNETWYAVLNDGGWSAVADFQMDYVVVRGDADNSGTTTAFDANDIWANRGDPGTDDSRYDIDGNGVITAFDASAAWGYRGSAAPTKPSGHGCTLP